MMEKEKHSQLELFAQANKENATRPNRPHNFLYYMRGYEKKIIIAIAFIITGIVSFSLGVEKGRTALVQRPDSRMDMAVRRPAEEPAQIQASQYKPVPQPQIKEETLETYMIQVASYQTKVFADKEAQALKKKGLSTLVLSKGRFIVLYVGKFSDRKTANSVLTQLRKQYRDCILRRL